MRRSTLAFSAMALGAALLGAPAARCQTVGVGSQPDYKFEQPLENGFVTKSLADLRGKPTLIEFWATW